MLKTEGVVSLEEKKEFTEPEIVKCEEPLDEVTLCYNRYNDYHHDNNYWGHGNWWRRWCR
jgi:hypothetical protein